MKRPTKLALGLISALFMTNIATAAEHGSRLDWNHYGMDCYGTNTMPGGYGADPVARVNKYLDELNAALKFTNDQQPAWQKFSGQVSEQAKLMAYLRDMMIDKSQRMPKTTPEQMAKMSEMMKDRAQDMARMADAVNIFYSTLTPEQRTAFDKVHMSQMGQMDRRSHKPRAQQPPAAQ